MKQEPPSEASSRSAAQETINSLSFVDLQFLLPCLCEPEMGSTASGVLLQNITPFL
jgi:hypothetical protein